MCSGVELEVCVCRCSGGVVCCAQEKSEKEHGRGGVQITRKHASIPLSSSKITIFTDQRLHITVITFRILKAH